MFEIEGCELEIRDDALHAIAARAMERKTGARGLRTILENVLLNSMYEIPSQRNISKIVVDEAVIRGEQDPYYIYEQRRENNLAAGDNA